jgi:GNAT superfamily N-acetyltransferase
MIQTLNISDVRIAKQVLDLQLLGYRVEADLIGFDGIPPLHDTVHHLQACKEVFLGFFHDAVLTGLISYEWEDNDTITICRMMVHPLHFQKGIASTLLKQVLTEGVAKKYKVSTGAKNLPAKQFYTRHGFTETMTREVAPGVDLFFFERMATGD